MSGQPTYGQSAYPQAPVYGGQSNTSQPVGVVGNAPYNPQPTYSQQWKPPQNTQQYGVSQKSTQNLAHVKQDSGWNDVCFFIVWWVQFIGMLGLAGYFISQNRATIKTDAIKLASSESVMALGALLVVGALCAIFWLMFMYHNAEFMVKCSIYTCLVMFIVAAGACAYMSAWMGCFIFVLCGAIFALYFWCVWERVEFAAMCIKLASSAIHKVSTVLWVSFFSIFIQIAWVLIWGYGALMVQQASEPVTDSSGNTTAPTITGGVYYAVVLYLIISFYWTAQQITAVVHSTVSGAVAMWYLFYGTNPNDVNKGMPGSATCGALSRAMGRYFGSIAFGSFVIALIKTIKLLLRYMMEKGGGAEFLACIALCIMNCIDRMFQYFNKYALVQVAVYGKTYCQAAKKTWALFNGEDENGNQQSGDVWDAVINDDLIELCLGMASLFSGLVCAVVGWALCEFVWSDLKESFDGQGSIMYLIIGFIIGFVICMLAMTVVESAVATIFVLYIEQPEALAKSKPDKARDLGAGWARIYGHCPTRNRYLSNY